ncbi:unnamed protein product [Trichogramma brassicae]|uniref:Reverse transcriptase domain-containing protein n=1 Tax=Trichogramma brassicae TaxID=86971 RepID=A0A6H5IFI5_9HYME|nr:unnamed protein product [Trichogramma brassicae]
MGSNATIMNQIDNLDNEVQVPEEVINSTTAEAAEPGIQPKVEDELISKTGDTLPTSGETEKPSPNSEAETAQEEDIAWAEVTAKLKEVREKYCKVREEEDWIKADAPYNYVAFRATSRVRPADVERGKKREFGAARGPCDTTESRLLFRQLARVHILNTVQRAIDEALSADPIVARSLKFQHECEVAMSAYRELYKDFLRRVKQTLAGWQVEREVFTNSDHRAITFNLSAHRPHRSSAGPRRRWCARKLDVEAFSERLSSARIPNANATPGHPEDMAAVFITTITEACSVSMPSGGGRHRRHESVYWWTDEIAALRRQCLRARRLAQRARGRAAEEARRADFAFAKSRLRAAIEESKRRCWSALCNEVDRDVWGRPYGTVMSRLKGPRATPPREPTLVRRTVAALFPTVTEALIRPPAGPAGAVIPGVTLEELRGACTRIRDGAAPGPDGVPNRALKLAVVLRPDAFLRVYSACLSGGVFQSPWKRQRLVLLSKPGRPPDAPSSYRPLCMLDTVDKILKRIICRRLEGYTEAPDGLSDHQHGFRRGRSTVDAIESVTTAAREAVGGARGSRKYCAVITLDVRNAFNSARLDHGVRIVGFADDITVVTVAGTTYEVEDLLSRAIARVCDALWGLGLETADHKTEALLFSRKRRLETITIEVGDCFIASSPCIRYLGIQLDARLTFNDHLIAASEKASKVAGALSQIMSTIGGPRSSRRRLYANVIDSILLYGTPIWSCGPGARAGLRRAEAIHRRACLRVISGRPHLSYDAAYVLASIPPLALLADERSRLHQRHHEDARTEERQETLRRWQSQWDRSPKGRWTHRLIPNIRSWIERRHEERRTCKNATFRPARQLFRRAVPRAAPNLTFLHVRRCISLIYDNAKFIVPSCRSPWVRDLTSTLTTLSEAEDYEWSKRDAAFGVRKQRLRLVVASDAEHRIASVRSSRAFQVRVTDLYQTFSGVFWATRATVYVSDEYEVEDLQKSLHQANASLATLDETQDHADLEKQWTDEVHKSVQFVLDRAEKHEGRMEVLDERLNGVETAATEASKRIDTIIGDFEELKNQVEAAVSTMEGAGPTKLVQSEVKKLIGDVLVKQAPTYEFHIMAEDADMIRERTQDIHTLLEILNFFLGEELPECVGRLLEHQPFFVKPYPIPFNYREQVRQEIQKMLDWKLIRPSKSRYISPLVVVIKKDQSIRLCLDARKINECLMEDFAMPINIDDLLQQCYGVTVMSSLDLTSSFYQIPLTEDSKKYCAFLHEEKVYEFNVVPFGLKVSSAGLIRGLEHALHGIGDNVLNFVDDLLCISPNEADHIKCLDNLLGRLARCNLTLNFKKLKLLCSRVESPMRHPTCLCKLFLQVVVVIVQQSFGIFSTARRGDKQTNRIDYKRDEIPGSQSSDDELSTEMDHFNAKAKNPKHASTSPWPLFGRIDVGIQAPMSGSTSEATTTSHAYNGSAERQPSKVQVRISKNRRGKKMPSGVACTARPTTSDIAVQTENETSVTSLQKPAPQKQKPLPPNYVSSKKIKPAAKEKKTPAAINYNTRDMYPKIKIRVHPPAFRSGHLRSHYKPGNRDAKGRFVGIYNSRFIKAMMEEFNHLWAALGV